MQPLRKIYLYDEPNAPGLDIEDIGGFLASQFPTVEVHPRTDFFTYQFSRFAAEQRKQLEPEVVRQLQRVQVTDLEPPGLRRPERPTSPEELDLGLVFIASAYQQIMGLLINPEENTPDQLHLVFTENAIGSWENDLQPFRLQILCLGTPAIISTTGLVEALPRPKEYLFKRAQLAMLGMDEEALEDLAEQFADRTFGYGDPRINEICKGYTLMACFDRVFGEAFCPDPACRLHLATSQQELIATQCGQSVGLCERHRTMLSELAPG